MYREAPLTLADLARHTGYAGGYGSAASGYGPGGVDQPAYRPGTPNPVARPVTQDRWGRTQDDPDYNRPPRVTPPGTQPTTTDATTPPTGAAPRTPGERTNVAGSGYGGYSYGGFDFEQDAANRDTGRSAKYTFAEATREAGEAGAGDGWKTKAGAAEYAEKWLKPRLEAAGYKVLEIRGEKMRIVTREDIEAGNTQGSWIDWVINADGENPQLAWQVESGTRSPSTSATTPTTATTAPINTTQPAPINPNAYDPLVDSVQDQDLTLAGLADLYGRMPRPRGGR